MKIKSFFAKFTKFEIALWVISVASITAAFLCVPEKDYLTLVASVLGVTAILLVAKGLVAGEILTVVFAVFYGVISYFTRYYGEMVAYLGLTAPIAIMTAISWIKHPCKDGKSVEVSSLTKTKIIIMFALAAVVTVGFYFILKALNNANLIFSTISITTSFIAGYLTLVRSHFYALAYLANDIILIVLWSLAAVSSP